MAKNQSRAPQGEGAPFSLRKGDSGREGKSGELSTESPPSADTTASWDPYQVWLTRVKEPREQSARRQSQPAVVEPSNSTDLSDTARLRVLSAALPR